MCLTHPSDDKANRIDHGILEQYVDRIFFLDKTRFQAGKTEVHDKNQHRSNEHPDIICSK